VADFPDITVVPHRQREIPAEAEAEAAAAAAVLGLYQAAGWWPERTAEPVRAMLRASPVVVTWHREDLN
jgi:hypothetical protein